MTPDWGAPCPAPAKLNLFLHVVGRRADGYHLLQTVFRLIDRCDLLRFEPRSDGRIVRADPIPGVADELDLTVRAAQALRAAAGERRGVTIHLDKTLPMGGGLGGGSSDAATTLIALNRLWGIGFPRDRLQDMGLALGADVPVFVYGRNAFAEGVGERLRPVELPPAWYLVLEPPVSIATADIFRSPLLRRDTPVIEAETWRPGDGGNDLETVACALAPEVARHLAVLRPYGRARMSGSGSCVFVEFPDATAAHAALAALPEGVRGWVAASLPAHPLRG